MKLIIPPKIQKTAPKPTKTQLVEALLDKAQKRHNAAYAIWEKKHDELSDKIINLLKLALGEAKIEDFTFCNGVSEWRMDPGKARIELSNAKIVDAQKALKAHYGKKPRFDAEHTKKKIVESMKPANPLLNNTEVDAALEQLLDSISNVKTVSVKAIEV